MNFAGYIRVALAEQRVHLVLQEAQDLRDQRVQRAALD
jgi:hypothetical protein